MPVDTLLSFIASERTQSWGFSQKPVGNKGLNGNVKIGEVQILPGGSNELSHRR